MEINNKVEIEDSIHSGIKTLLPTWVHVDGTCYFLLRRTVAMSRMRPPSVMMLKMKIQVSTPYKIKTVNLKYHMVMHKA